MLSSTTHSLQSGFIQIHRNDPDAIHAELVAGLLAPQAESSPKYLYDALGSRLFEAICELPEYYPTRPEATNLDDHLADIASAAGRGVSLIDLGADNRAKPTPLFSALNPAQYVPVD